MTTNDEQMTALPGLEKLEIDALGKATKIIMEIAEIAQIKYYPLFFTLDIAAALVAYLTVFIDQSDEEITQRLSEKIVKYIAVIRKHNHAPYTEKDVIDFTNDDIFE